MILIWTYQAAEIQPINLFNTFQLVLLSFGSPTLFGGRRSKRKWINGTVHYVFLLEIFATISRCNYSLDSRSLSLAYPKDIFKIFVQYRRLKSRSHESTDFFVFLGLDIFFYYSLTFLFLYIVYFNQALFEADTDVLFYCYFQFYVI